jgi:hypothetical protein
MAVTPNPRIRAASVRVSADAGSPRSDEPDETKGGRPMEGIWIAVSFVFVFGTIAVTTFAIGRMFGGWHRHGH